MTISPTKCQLMYKNIIAGTICPILVKHENVPLRFCFATICRQINSATGLISVGIGAKLDRETTERYGFNLTVLAIDKGSPPVTGTTTVSIRVEDVNDSPPNISPVTGVFTVFENASIGDEVRIVTVSVVISV